MTSPRVSLDSQPGQPEALTRLATAWTVSNVDGALAFARQLGHETQMYAAPGSTRDLWEALATVASVDLGSARAIEPHLDALAILREAEISSQLPESLDASWGVFAAEGGSDPLAATQVGRRWSLTGTKPWCSLADRLDCALVTAHLTGRDRGLFAVDLRAQGVTPLEGQWHARGLAEIPSGPVAFLDVTAVPVGEPGWYLRRPGFAWGGMAVAACWFGGAVGVARTLFANAGASPDPLTAAHLGAVDGFLQSARRALVEAASLADKHPSDADVGLLTKRVRGTVAYVSEQVLTHTAHALGPAPLALDREHAKRVADLQLYIRQHHAEKDDASLGAALAKNEHPPW
jgi:alkylation response protein AidB-like acyl-CoA dehydrogenase